MTTISSWKKDGRSLPNNCFIHRIYLYKPVHIWLRPSIWGLTSQFKRFTFLSTNCDGWTILKRVELSFTDKHWVWSRCAPFIRCKTLILTYKITTLSPISILEQQQNALLQKSLQCLKSKWISCYLFPVSQF